MSVLLDHPPPKDLSPIRAVSPLAPENPDLPRHQSPAETPACLFLALFHSTTQKGKEVRKGSSQFPFDSSGMFHDSKHKLDI
jgi:hypothetical protein